MVDRVAGPGNNEEKSGRGENPSFSILSAGAAAGLLVAFYLTLVAVAWYRFDRWKESASVLSTFSWMLAYYLIAALLLGLLISLAVHRMLQRSPVRRNLSFPIIVAALLSIAAVVDVLVLPDTGAPRMLTTRMAGAALGIAAAIGAGAIIVWLQKRRFGPWLFRAIVVMIPVALVVIVLKVEFQNRIRGALPQRVSVALLFLVGFVFCGVAAALFARMSQKGKRICLASFGLCCIALLVVSLALGDQDARSRNGSREGTPRTSPLRTGSSNAPPAPNVLMISIDTLRADGLSCYGNPRRTSPAIDAIASKGILFRHVYSTSSWTLPGHASMFTGLYSASHGADKSYEGYADRIVNPILSTGPTLAEKLRGQGYHTAGFIANPWISSKFGLDPGFDEYYEELDKQKKFMGVTDSLLCRTMLALGVWNKHDLDGSLSVDESMPQIVRWVETHSQEPFFLFLHFIEPHSIYDPPAKYRLDSSGKPIPIFQEMDRLISGEFSLPPERQAQLSALYEGEIRYLDDRLSELFHLLDRLGLSGHTLLIITSDHGESLGEHGLWTHGNSLFEEQVRVPLIMRLPGVIPAGQVSDDQIVSLVDLMPSILDITGAPPARGMQGRSLKPVWEGRAEGKPQAVYAELRPDVGWHRTNPNLGWGFRMIRTLDSKYIEGDKGERELYLTTEDPREEHNAIDKQPALAQKLELAIRAWQGRTAPPGKSSRMKLSPEMIRQLRALGYVQ